MSGLELYGVRSSGCPILFKWDQNSFSNRRRRHIHIVLTEDGNRAGDPFMIVIDAMLNVMREGQTLTQQEQRREQDRDKTYAGQADHICVI